MMRKKAPMRASADACLMRAHHLASRKRNASGCLMQQGRATQRITHQAHLMRTFLNTGGDGDSGLRC